MRRGALLLAGLTCLLMLGASRSSRVGDAAMNQHVLGFELPRHTVDGGGAMFSTGDDFELSDTIGQPDAGVMAGDDFELSGGFWFPIAPGDMHRHVA